MNGKSAPSMDVPNFEGLFAGVTQSSDMLGTLDPK